MKLTRFPLTTLGPSLAFACLLGGSAQAQLADDAAARKPPPLPGTYYSAQRPTYPPLPWNPFPDLPLYSWGERRFIYDDREVDYSLLKSETAESAAPLVPTVDHSALLTSMGDCASELLIFRGSNAVTLLVTNATAGKTYDLFTTGYLLGGSITNSFWRWLASATNGQWFTFSTQPCREKYFVLGCDTDSDNDDLTDAYEVLVTKTSPATNHSVNALFTDKQMENILVNDPDQDCGNEQNTQFESTCAVLGSNVIVAYVDSNRGVYALGQDGRLTNYTPRLVGYAVSTNGGNGFTDMDVPPLDAAGFGDAGDPVLAVDTASNVVYLVGTSPRQPAATAHDGICFWKSLDGGSSFTRQPDIHDDILGSDKPWIAVDNWPGTGQHDVYAICTGRTNAGMAGGLWLAVSRDGQGGGWTNGLLKVREPCGGGASYVHCAIPQVGPDHIAYVFWYESTGPSPNYTNWLKMCQVRDRGSTVGDAQTICRLRTLNPANGNLELKRSNTATNTDTFRVFPFPVPAVNPVKTNHLYVAYADRGTNSNDKADIFFLQSTNGGTTWTNLVRVNTDSTANDQWMPVFAVKPDGTQLFLAWYDRRHDTNNSLIELIGRFGTIGTNAIVSFGTEFKISTTSFPPVFAGTDTNNLAEGHYDPVYPPGGVNLHWWYPEWPDDPFEITPIPEPGVVGIEGHVGEYNGAWGAEQFVYVSWTDYRLVAPTTLYPRNQSDIRLVRLVWPE